MRKIKQFISPYFQGNNRFSSELIRNHAQELFQRNINLVVDILKEIQKESGSILIVKNSKEEKKLKSIGTDRSILRYLASQKIIEKKDKHRVGGVTYVRYRLSNNAKAISWLDSITPSKLKKYNFKNEALKALQQAENEFANTSAVDLAIKAHNRITSSAAELYLNEAEKIILDTGGGIDLERITKIYNDLTGSHMEKEQISRYYLDAFKTQKDSNGKYFLKSQCDIFGKPLKDYGLLILETQSQIEKAEKSLSEQQDQKSDVQHLESEIEAVTDEISKAALFDFSNKKRLREQRLSLDEKLKHLRAQQESYERKQEELNRLRKRMKRLEAECEQNKRLFWA